MSCNLDAPLAIDDLRRARAAARFGRTIHYFDRIDSTNTARGRLARDGAAEGTVVIAEAQTKGRGRLGRTWVSPPLRNLYLSIVLRPPIATAEAPRLALVAGLATAETVARVDTARGDQVAERRARSTGASSPASSPRWRRTTTACAA